MDDPLAKDPTGILVGNPCTYDDDDDDGDDGLIGEAYKFGFIAPDTYHTLTSDECSDAFEMMDDDDDDDDDNGNNDDGRMNYFYDDDDAQMDDDQQQQDPERRKKTRAGNRLPPKNRKLFQMLHKKRNEGGIGTRLLPPGNRNNKLQRMLRRTEQTKQKETRGIGFDPVVKKCLSAFYESSFSSGGYFQDGIDFYGVYNPWVGSQTGEGSPLAEYLSQDNVQIAIHVKVADVTTFSACSDKVVYTKQYAACNPDPEFPDISMINFYQEIVPELKKTWIFSGDTDVAVPMEVSLRHAFFDYRVFVGHFP